MVVLIFTLKQFFALFFIKKALQLSAVLSAEAGGFEPPVR